MRRRSRLARSLLLLVFWSAFAAGAPALADDDEHDERRDHDEVRRVVERGEALPLDTVLAAVASWLTTTALDPAAATKNPAITAPKC